VLLAGLGGVALAAESRFDDIDDDLMRGMDDAVKDLEPALSAGNIESATADAEILRDGLKWTHDYFTGKGGVDDGVKIAADGQSLVVELQKHLADKNVDAAVTAARQTSKNCRSCHDIYKP
jgi:hypothetical protein